MKYIIVIIATLFMAGQTFASVNIPNYTNKISDEDLTMYKEALYAAYIEAGLDKSCDPVDIDGNHVIVADNLMGQWREGVSLYLQDGENPLLIIRVGFDLETTVYDWEFYTAGDQSSLTKFNLVRYIKTKTRVNKGTLSKPDMVDVITVEKELIKECIAE